MVQLWVIVSLVVSAVAVSILGAAFSILGLGALFSGAVLAVCLMAGSMELAKFTIAALLHQTWNRLNWVLKTYMVAAVVVLSVITSMGIFGFLSDAYQESSTVLESETVKLDSLVANQSRIEGEITRINQAIEQIPNSRITKKMQARAEAEPELKDLAQKRDRISAEVTQAKLLILEVKRKVGPLLYIAKMMDKDIDTIVKYLIGLFVFVFDPLAICLVIAVSFALETRRNQATAGTSTASKVKMKLPAGGQPAQPSSPSPSAPPLSPIVTPAADASPVVASVPEGPVLAMRFADEAANATPTPDQNKPKAS